MTAWMLLLAGAPYAVAAHGLARAVAVFSFTVALSAQPARCALQRHPSLRYRGLSVVKLGQAGAGAPESRSLPESVALLAFGPVEVVPSSQGSSHVIAGPRPQGCLAILC